MWNEQSTSRNELQKYLRDSVGEESYKQMRRHQSSYKNNQRWRDSWIADSSKTERRSYANHRSKDDDDSERSFDGPIKELRLRSRSFSREGLNNLKT
jgi:hypothetical protein